MMVPSAEFIESASDDLKKVDAAVLADQQRELYEATGKEDANLVEGYNLGLQVARLMIQVNPELAIKGIDVKGIL